MAQIPDWTAIGQQTPQPSYRRVTVDDSAAHVWDQAAGLGGTIEKVADDQWSQQQQLMDAKAQNAVEQHALSVQTAAMQMKDDIATGKVPYDQAQDQFKQQLGKIPQPDLDGLRAPVTSLLQGRMLRNLTDAQLGMDQAINGARKDDFKAQFGQGLDLLGKQAGMPSADIDDINKRADIYRPLGRNAGLPEAYIDKSIQDFKDRNWLNQATQRSMEAKDNPQALQQLQHDLTDADGAYAGKLDTDKRNMVLRGVINDQLILQNRAERDQDKREAKAQRTIGQIDEQISSGVPATPDMWEQWQSQTKGTSFADDFKQRLKDEDQVQQVLRQPVDQQQAYVQQRQQQLDTEGGTLKDKANLNRLKAAVNQNTNLMQTAPLLFDANRTGTQVQPLDFGALNQVPPVLEALHAHLQDQTGGDPTPQQQSQQQFQSQIADRMATLKAMRTQYGPGVAQAPLLPQEAKMLSNQLENATPQDRAQMLVRLRGSMNDDDAYQSTMRQIAPHSPVTALAGSMVGTSAPASTPVWFDHNFASKISDVGRILRGDELLNPPKQDAQEKGELKSRVPMPPDGSPTTPGLRDAFSNAADDLFRGRPDLGETYYATFKAADAALRAESGKMDGAPNTAIEKQALKITLGNVINFNGSRVKVPDGMDPSKFSGYVNDAIGSVVKAAGGKADWPQKLEGYRLHEIGGVGTGRYQVMDGAMPFARPDGKGPLTIDLRGQNLPSVQPSQPAQPSANGAGAP